MKQKWYEKKWVVIALHIFAWALLFSLPYLLRLTASAHDQKPQHTNVNNSNAGTYFSLLMNITWVVIFYFNAFVLIPGLVNKKKYWQFAVAQLIIFTCLFFEVSFLMHMFFNIPYYTLQALVFNFFIYLFIFALSTAFRLISDKVKTDKLASEKENENLKTELSFLRSQVSPHFMFNVLNNMVAMARKQSGELEPSLIKLSSLMRYMLYETDEEKVPLEKEIEYLQSYIDLQQQRFGKNVKVNVSLVALDKPYEIEPMLLIPFVENAFKHGTGMVENAAIDIELKAEKNILQFSVRNKFNEASEEVRDKTSGIGLANVKRRLALLYGANQSCWITKKDNWFHVSLQLNLH